MVFLKRKDFYYLLFLDIIAIISSMSLALALRFDFSIPSIFITSFRKTILFIVIGKIVIFLLFRLYQRIWEHAGLEDYLMIFVGIATSSCIFYVINIVFKKYFDFPKSIIVIDFIIMIVLINGIRISIRLLRRLLDTYLVKKEGKPFKNILIYGAGVGGEQIIREIDRNNFLRYLVVGFIDDDVKKKNMIIHNKKVLGTRKDIPKLILKHKVEEILIAIPSLKGKGMKELINFLKPYKVEIKTLPSQSALIDGNVYINQIRPVEIEDLLGRDIVELDTGSISHYLKNKTILITGAGGSIGSEIARQIIPYNPKMLLLLGKGENSIFSIAKEIETNYPEITIERVIADISNYESIKNVFNKYKPEVIFNAAAHKHVYMMELNPKEAFKNNVIGSKNVMQCASENNSEKYVQISTDKAVNPTSVMGATKRITELVMSNYANSGSKCIFSAVRFGNVLGSRGSVIPIFKEQISNGGPITVTHPEVIRYFMTIPEASQLVLQAGGLSKGGEIYILDMGKPVKIIDLAKDLIRLSGLKPYKDIDITITGLKPGEKLIEEILTKEEGVSSTKYKKIFIAPKKEINAKNLSDMLDSLINSLYSIKDEEIRKEIFKLATTFP